MSNLMYKQIGKKITFYRSRKGISQLDLAKKLGYASQTAVSYFESGMRKIKIEDLKRIAVFLDVSINELLFSEGDKAVFADSEGQEFNKVNNISHEDFSSPQKFSSPVSITHKISWVTSATK